MFVSAVVATRNLVAPTTAYANAGGTGDRTASITVTTSTAPAGGGAVSQQVDGAGLDGNTGPFWTVANMNGYWSQFDFGAGVKKYITEIKLYKQNLTLDGTWYYEASNNASTWVDVSTADFTPGASVITTTTCLPPDIEGYRYYRFHHRATAPTGQPRITEFEFKIAPGAT